MLLLLLRTLHTKLSTKTCVFGHFGNVEWYAKLVWKRKLGHENGAVWCIRVIISQNVLKLFLLVQNFSTIVSSFFQVQICSTTTAFAVFTRFLHEQHSTYAYSMLTKLNFLTRVRTCTQVVVPQ